MRNKGNGARYWAVFDELAPNADGIGNESDAVDDFIRFLGLGLLGEVRVDQESPDCGSWDDHTAPKRF